MHDYELLFPVQGGVLFLCFLFYASVVHGLTRSKTPLVMSVPGTLYFACLTFGFVIVFMSFKKEVSFEPSDGLKFCDK